jgi:hypothetical protein
METLIKQAEQNFEHLFDRTEKQCCIHKRDHEKFKAAFICSEPNCTKRLICSMCMISDENHKAAHKNFIKPVAEMRAYVVDRCNDKFVSEISLITQDLTAKFNSKINSCATISTTLTSDLLSTQLPISISALQNRFNQKLTTPVHSLAERAQLRIENIAKAAKEATHEGIEEELADAIVFIDQKGVEEKAVWDTAGKVMQRVKHRILYNKEVEANLRKDLDSLSKKFVEDIVKTFESYFFLEDDIDQDSPIKDPMVAPIRNSSPKKVSQFAFEDGKELYEFTKEITSSHVKRLYDEHNTYKTKGGKGKEESDGSELSEGGRTWNAPHLSPYRDGSPFRQITVSQIKTLSPLPKLDEAIVQESDRPSSRENWDNLFLQDKKQKSNISESRTERKSVKISWDDDVNIREKKRDLPTDRDRSNSASKRGSQSKLAQLKIDSQPLASSPSNLPDTPNTQLRMLKEFVELSGIKNLVQKSILRTRPNVGRNAFELWVPNDETQFSKMFKEDFRYFILNDILQPDEVAGFMQSFYELYYPGLFYVFLHYQSRSMTYPGLSWMDVNRLMADCGILGEGFYEQDLDEIFEDISQNFQSISSKDNHNQLDNIPEKSLLRSGFMAYLARVALCRYYSGRI